MHKDGILRAKFRIVFGDNGIIYVSYEDVNISKELFGIVKATDTVDYDNIYQYDVYYPANVLYTSDSKIMLCNIFDRKNSEKEYLTQISLYAPQTYTCRVFVNPNGTNKSKKDMIKRYTKFIIAHFALYCNSAFRSDLYFLKSNSCLKRTDCRNDFSNKH